MSSIRLDVELTTVDPAGETVYVEGRAPDGTQIALYLLAASVRGSALAAGKRVTVTLELPAAATAPPGPSLRERMGRASAATSGAASGTAASGAPVAAAATSAGANGPAAGGAVGTRATPMTSARTSAAPAARSTEAASAGRTDAILSFMLGKPSADVERDIDDEMDALLGTKRG